MGGVANSLQLVDTVKTAVRHLWVERVSITKMLGLAGLANGFLAWISSAMVAKEKFEWFYLLAIPQILVYTLLAVRVHRIVLSGMGANQDWLRWTGRETRFLGWLVVVYFYWTLILIPLVAAVAAVGAASGFTMVSQGVWVNSIALTLATVPGAYVFVRLVFLLPATAVDQKRNMRWAWTLSEGNGWRLVALLCVLPMFISLVLPDWESSNPVFFVAWETVYGMLTVLEIAFLSVAFRNLGGISGTLLEAVASDE